MILFDMRKLSELTDYCIVVTGNSPPHLKAMFEAVLEDLRKTGVRPRGKCGDPESGWMIIDYLDVIIHILSRRARQYYALEKLWGQAPCPEC